MRLLHEGKSRETLAILLFGNGQYSFDMTTSLACPLRNEMLAMERMVQHWGRMVSVLLNVDVLHLSELYSRVNQHVSALPGQEQE